MKTREKVIFIYVLILLLAGCDSIDKSLTETNENNNVQMDVTTTFVTKKISKEDSKKYEDFLEKLKKYESGDGYILNEWRTQLGIQSYNLAIRKGNVEIFIADDFDNFIVYKNR